MHGQNNIGFYKIKFGIMFVNLL